MVQKTITKPEKTTISDSDLHNILELRDHVPQSSVSACKIDTGHKEQDHGEGL